MSTSKDGKANVILFRLSVADLRKRLKLAGFQGSVRALDALGAVSDDDFRCAQLRCSRDKPNELFINTRINCSHRHLTVDVMDLVTAYKQGDLDHGWERKPNDDAETSICTRGNAARVGIPRNAWATNPYRVS